MIYTNSFNTIKSKDMRAKWIAPAGVACEQNLYFRVRKIFPIENKPDKILLHIAAETYYILYLNGRLVGRGPVRGTHENNYFDTYEVASFLNSGENFICVLCCCMNIDTFVAAPAEPGVILELEEIVSTDSSWEALKAEEWKKDVCIYTIQTGFSEWRDFRKEPLGWLTFEDSRKWEKAIEIPSSSKIHKKRLIPRDIPELAEQAFSPVDIPVAIAVPRLENAEDIFVARNMTEESHMSLPHSFTGKLNTLCMAGLKNLTVKPLTDNSGLAFVLDFGREIIGRFELDISAPDGTIVDICHEEELWSGRLRADRINDNYNFADRYILRKGRQLIGNSLFERGYRMVQVVIRNFNKPVTVHNARAIDARYPFVKKGSFFCSDNLLNRIWDVCCETLSACATDVFIDCPWRERSFWVNDMIVENRTTLQAFGDSRINARAFRLAFADRDEQGLVPGVCPAPKDKKARLTLLPSNLYMARMLKDYCLYTGDLEMAKNILPEMFKIIDVFSSWINEDGLIKPPEKYWNFFDWSYGLSGINYDGKITSLMNFFYIMTLKDCIEIGEMSGIETNKEKYLKLIRKVKNATEKYLLKDNRFADCKNDDGSLGNPSKLAQALALLTGEFDDSFLIDGLLDRNLLIPELYFQFFIFEALSKVNREDAILRTIRKYWGEIVMSGTPTIWEAGIHGKGKNAFAGNGSLCHGFATAPVDFMQSSILGVYPLKPGFRKFKVSPIHLDLDFAEGRVPTPEGNIHIRWDRIGDVFKVALMVPAGLTACTDAGEFGSGKHEFELMMGEENEKIFGNTRESRKYLRQVLRELQEQPVLAGDA